MCVILKNKHQKEERKYIVQTYMLGESKTKNQQVEKKRSNIETKKTKATITFYKAKYSTRRFELQHLLQDYQFVEL